MSDCRICEFSQWDYEEYYGTDRKEWFMCGCIKNMDYEEDTEDCEGYQKHEVIE